MIDRDILNTLPYLVIEELKPNSPVSGVFSVDHNVPIAFSRIRYITRVHAVRFSQRGCYLGKNLGKNPHYTVSKEDFELHIRRRCKDLEIPLKVYSADKIMQVSDIITVFNFSDEEHSEKRVAAKQEMVNTEKLETLLDQLRIPELRHDEGNVEKDKIRGPTQRHFGYGSNYSLTRLD